MTPRQGDPFVAVSLYAVWEGPHSSTGNQYIFADASAHRLISDLSRFIGSDRKRGILAAGDLNILHGHGEHGSGYWAARYQTVFDRMEALGLTFAGPQAPDGRQADPWPAELPLESKNVPTFHHNRQTPARATIQGDASTGLRLRIPGAVRFGAGARPQRPGAVGTQRPLPRGDRGLLTVRC